MVNKNEGYFFKNYVRPKLKSWGVYTRIENAVGSGTPDINFAISGSHGWIETKVVKQDMLWFEKFQIPWLIRYHHHMEAKNLWVLSTDWSYVYLYGSYEILNAPRKVMRGTNKTWTCVSLRDIEPDVKVDLATPGDWNKVKLALTGAI